VAFQVVSISSAEYVGTGYINDGSTMDQRCIVGTSIASTCSSWLLLARTCTTASEEERQRQTNRDRETQKLSRKLFSSLLQSSIVAFQVVSISSAEYVGTGYINDGLTMDQRCIVGTSIASTCSSWLLLARTCTTTSEEERQRQTNRDRETQKLSWK